MRCLTGLVEQDSSLRRGLGPRRRNRSCENRGEPVGKAPACRDKNSIIHTYMPQPTRLACIWRAPLIHSRPRKFLRNATRCDTRAIMLPRISWAGSSAAGRMPSGVDGGSGRQPIEICLIAGGGDCTSVGTYYCVRAIVVEITTLLKIPPKMDETT
jgi:hypothetical protein